MSGSVIGAAMNLGFAGNPSRTPDCIIEARPVKSTSANIPFGKPVLANNDGTVSLGGATLTATNFIGIAIAEVKQGLTYLSQGGVGYYGPLQPCDYIKRGDVTVQFAVVGGIQPLATGAVWVRTVLSTAYPLQAVGDFITANDSGKAVQITTCCWKNGHVDGNNVTELTIKSINN